MTPLPLSKLHSLVKIVLFLAILFRTPLRADFTEEQVKTYDEKLFNNTDEVSALIESGFFKNSQEILDVGCGSGKLTALFAARLPHTSIVGCDLSKTSIEYALKYHTLPNLTFVEKNAEQLDFGKQFDTILSFNCLHWIKDQKRALTQLFHALKPGGKAFFVATPASSNNDFKTICRKIIFSFRWAPYFLTFRPVHSFYTKEEYEKLLKEMGFVIDKAQINQIELVLKNKTELNQFLEAVLTPLNHLASKHHPAFLEAFFQEIQKAGNIDADGGIHIFFDQIELTVSKHPQPLGASSMSATPHSSVLLSAKERDFWWNQDYLDLLAKRIDFSHVKTALDVGCGKGSWTKVIATLLPESATVVGIDREPTWIESIKPDCDRFRFSVADAHDLPFEDESFDLVTCQTLLIHVKDHKKVLEEMARVLKPGGLMVLSEPTNMANLLASNTAQQKLSLEEQLDTTKLYLVCQKGKELSGDGFSSIGPHLSYQLPTSIVYIQNFMSEKMMTCTPPYNNKAEESLLEFIYSAAGDNWYYFWSKESAQKYFLSVYPEGQIEFERLWKVAQKLNTLYRQQLEEKSFGGVVGGHLILTIGKKL